jgi:hypothetical protein
MKFAGIALIILGALALIYQGFSYTKEDKIVDIGPVEVNKETRKTIPLSPILGAVAVIGGVALIAGSRR